MYSEAFGWEPLQVCLHSLHNVHTLERQKKTYSNPNLQDVHFATPGLKESYCLHSKCHLKLLSANNYVTMQVTIYSNNWQQLRFDKTFFSETDGGNQFEEQVTNIYQQTNTWNIESEWCQIDPECKNPQKKKIMQLVYKVLKDQ